MFSGSIPALVTPFCDGTFSESHFRALVDWQIEQGSSALVPCGTTGEAPTLSYDEHYRVISICIEQAAGRVPVIAGCGSNDTATAVRHMQFAKAEGAALVPFLLAGVADSPRAAQLFQPDRIHPNAEAHPIMLGNVWPVLRPWLR